MVIAGTATERGTLRPDGFAARLREPQTTVISPALLSQLLGVSTQGLADMTRLHRNTLRNATSERLQAKLREIVKAIGAASDLTGDLDKAIYWYLNEPIAAYRYKTSAELVAEGQLDAVLAYIEDLANGATG